MSQDMSFMYDPELRQRAIATMQEQGVPLTGDNLQRAMALIANSSTPEENAVDVRYAADDPKLTGDILSRYMTATDRPTATAAQTPTSTQPAAKRAASSASPVNDAGASPPPAPSASSGDRGAAAQASNTAAKDDRSIDTKLKQFAGDFATKAGNALDKTLTMDNIGLALLGLTAPVGAAARGVSAVGQKLLPNMRVEPRLLTGPSAPAALEGPAPQKLLTASPQAKRAGIVELLQERIGPELRRIYQNAMQNSRPGSTYSAQLQ